MAGHGLETSFLSDVLLPLSLAVIMFGMGLDLRVADFKRLGRMPRSVIAGLTGQLLLMPLAAMAVVSVFMIWFGLSLELAIGLLLLAAVPGGATSNLLTFLGKGDKALSITLTSIVSLGAVLLTPLVLFGTTILLFGDARLISVSFSQMASLVLVIVAIPVGLGMGLRAWRPALRDRLQGPMKAGGAIFLALLVAGIIYQNRVGFWQAVAETFPAAIALNLAALGVGLWVGHQARLPEDQRRCLAFEVGFQNGTLGIVLAVTQLGSARAALMPGFYSLVMFITGGLLAWHWSQRAPRRAPVDPDVDAEVVIEPLEPEPSPA